MKEYRVSYKSLIVFSVLSGLLVYLAIGFVQTSEWIPAVGASIGAIVIGAFFIHYYRIRKSGAAISIDDEGVVFNFKGEKLYWSEIEKIQTYHSKFWENYRVESSTAFYPKTSAYKAIRTRFNKEYANPCYDVTWGMIERPKDFNATAHDRFEAYSRKETSLDG